MNVDEAGGDDVASRVDYASGTAWRNSSDPDNAIALYGYVAVERRAASSVYDTRVGY
jgi:hypothetical protein